MNTHPRRLSDDHRALLREIAARPGLSAAQVAAIFRARSGRPVNRSTARKAILGILSPGPAWFHLSAADRDRLEWLLRESGPGFSSREVAAQFAALVGREIHPSRVRRVAREIGVRTGRTGMPKGHVTARRAAALAAEAGRRKRGVAG